MDKIKIDDIVLKETEIIAREILLKFVDVYRYIIPIFDKGRAYRIPIQYYDKFREKNREQFSRELYRLKKARFVRKYIDKKGDIFLELRPKGKKRLKTYILDELEIKKPKKWDGKWRMVIYDIADDKKNERQMIKDKLESLGFLKLQESVYIYPFDCWEEIDLIQKMYCLDPHIQYIVADRVETEKNLINKFLDIEVLQKKMI